MLKVFFCTLLLSLACLIGFVISTISPAALFAPIKEPTLLWSGMIFFSTIAAVCGSLYLIKMELSKPK